MELVAVFRSEFVFEFQLLVDDLYGFIGFA
jgi:hypothetical protein